MKTIILTLIAILAAASTSYGQVESVNARFVAFHRFGGVNPREPYQQLVIQTVQTSDSVSRVFKAVYFPSTGGIRGSIEDLKPQQLRFTNIWKLDMRDPREEERRYCKFENYLRLDNGRSPDLDEKGQPILNFHSTQVDGWIVFDNLGSLPCRIIDSIQLNR